MAQLTQLDPKMKSLSEHLKVGSVPLGDESILVVKITAHDRDTINKWMDFSENVRREWDDVTKPLFILVDMSDSDFSFGAYANRRAADMMKIQPEIPTYIAWVIQKTVLGNLLQATLQAYNRTSRAARFMVVYNRQAGFDWLEETYQKDLNKDKVGVAVR